jgi:hypothetical protein
VWAATFTVAFSRPSGSHAAPRGWSATSPKDEQDDLEHRDVLYWRVYEGRPDCRAGGFDDFDDR